MPLPNCRSAAIGRVVSVRSLLACFVALAMAFAPFAMPMGEARASASTGHHSEMMQAGHCDGQQAPDQHKSQKEKPCCAAGCMAAAMLSASGGETIELLGSVDRPGLDRFRLGVPAEIATPPPRIS
jgi:hypothetical protein